MGRSLHCTRPQLPDKSKALISHPECIVSQGPALPQATFTNASSMEACRSHCNAAAGCNAAYLDNENHQCYFSTVAITYGTFLQTLTSNEHYVSCWTPTTATSCTDASAALPAAECSAWVELFDATKGTNWKNICSDKRTDPCGCVTGKYGGVHCQNNHIAALYLYNNALDGSVPDSMGDLRWLKIIQLNGNNLSGTIPKSLASLPLETMDMAGNHRVSAQFQLQ